MKSVKRSAAIYIMSSCTPVFVLNLSLCLKKTSVLIRLISEIRGLGQKDR